MVQHVANGNTSPPSLILFGRSDSRRGGVADEPQRESGPSHASLRKNGPHRKATNETHPIEQDTSTADEWDS
jgi:hypothetical protein